MGGLVLNAWGVVRGTKDVDVVIAAASDNIKRIAEVAVAAALVVRLHSTVSESHGELSNLGEPASQVGSEHRHNWTASEPGQGAGLLVVLAQARPNVEFHLIEPLLKLFERAGGTPQLHERPHDLDVHGDCPVAAKDSRQHRHSLLREDEGPLAPTAMPAT